MPRKLQVKSKDHYFHVTARSNNKESFFVEIEEVWKIMIDELSRLQKDFKIEIGAFVLMNNHFHLLILSPQEDLSRIMYFFMKNVTVKIQKKSGRINKIFGGRYKASFIHEMSYLLNAYKYIYQNPVKANITSEVQFYPYSTASWKVESSSEPFGLNNILGELGNIKNVKLWLNQEFSEQENKSIKFGLSKTTFIYQKDRNSGKTIAPINTLFP